MPAGRLSFLVSLLVRALTVPALPLLKTLLIPLLLLTLVPTAQGQSTPRSETLSFNKETAGKHLTLAYDFIDHQNNATTLSFQVDLETFTAPPFHFRPLSQTRLQRLIERQVRRYADEQNWHQMEIQQRGNGLQIQPRPSRIGLPPNSASDNRVTTLQTVAEQAQSEILSQHHYAPLQLHAQSSGYAPDHIRIAQMSTTALTPVADQLATHLQTHGYRAPRETLDFLLSWLQQIPYDALSDRQRSPGTGFLPPARVLHDNLGDCDSKVTLLASLFKILQPDIASAIVYLPSHAVFAVDLPSEAGDEWVAVEHNRWLIADPTGPARLNAGEIADRYRSPLRSGAITFKLF